MWMWYKCMEEATGTPKEDFHDYYKAKYLSRDVVVGKGGIGSPAVQPTSTPCR